MKRKSSRRAPAVSMLLVILVMAAAVAGAPGSVGARVSSLGGPPSYPRFAGAAYGAASGQAPVGGDFSFTCNTQAIGAAVRVSGHAVPAGSGITNDGSCGQAYLFINVPGAGRLKATVALANDATISAVGAPEARIAVLGTNGYTSHTEDIVLTKGGAKTVDIDVAGAVTVSFAFPNGADTYVYDMHLSGTARIRHATPLSGGGMAVGGSPLATSRAGYTCNAGLTTKAVSVSHVTIPVGAAIELLPCGIAALKIPAGSSGTLALRFGANDLSDYSSVPTVFDVRVLDAGGYLLRKAIGLAFAGSGLQPIWVNVSGGATVTLTADAGSAVLDLTGFALLTDQYKQHPNPDHNEFGSPSGSPVSIVPEAFAVDCNAHPGEADVTVNRQAVARDTYLYATDCGVASLVMTNAHGTFHALVGVDDTTTPQKTGAVKLTVLDQNGKPIFTTSVRADLGKRAVPLNAPITGASIVKLEITGPVVIYDLQLTGHATFYDRVFPPSEPPTTLKGGVALNPLAFTVGCNTAVSKSDILLLHAAALEQWALDGQGCGTAILNLGSVKGPHATFGGRFALAAADQRLKIGHVVVSVLGGNGKVLRTMTLTAREGYGPATFGISLSGGAKLNLSWSDQRVILLALSLA